LRENTSLGRRREKTTATPKALGKGKSKPFALAYRMGVAKIALDTVSVVRDGMTNLGLL
jgi:hypothetical protein